MAKSSYSASSSGRNELSVHGPEAPGCEVAVGVGKVEEEPAVFRASKLSERSKPGWKSKSGGNSMLVGNSKPGAALKSGTKSGLDGISRIDGKSLLSREVVA
jgi:hypothetical protein